VLVVLIHAYDDATRSLKGKIKSVIPNTGDAGHVLNQASTPIVRYRLPVWFWGGGYAHREILPTCNLMWSRYTEMDVLA